MKKTLVKKIWIVALALMAFSAVVSTAKSVYADTAISPVLTPPPGSTSGGRR